MKVGSLCLFFFAFSWVVDAAAHQSNETTSSAKFAPQSSVICGLEDTGRVTCQHALAKSSNGFSVPASVPFPKMPTMIRAILYQDFNVLDPRGEEMLSELHKIDAAVEFAHARTTFYQHLEGTFGILAAWDQPEVVRRTGLAHTAYSGDLFQFFLFDATSEAERAEVRGILGERAEALTYLFGTVNRGGLCNFASVVNKTSTVAITPTGPQTVYHRITGTWDVSAVDAANILMVTIADYLDQMVDTNGWRDHHQIDYGASVLYPGDGKPAVAFYWFAAVCNAIKDQLEVIPPIFNYCTELISVEDETKARDAYWNVVQHEKTLTEDEQVVLLYESIRRNSFIAEPHVMLSQIFYRQGHYYQAAVEARMALEKYYILASAWDKRRTFEYWVGFARILLLRANRKLEENSCHLPCADEQNPIFTNYNNLRLTPLRKMFEEMREREE